MKKLLHIAFLFLCVNTSAQNLVPDASIENMISCPGGTSTITYYSWVHLSLYDWTIPAGGSSDYFNVCATTLSGAGAPANSFGSQYPRTGDGYAGGIIASYYGDMTSNTREYLQTKLASPLTAGHTIYGSYWINKAEWSGIGTVGGIDQMGMHFDTTYEERVGVTGILSDLTPQIKSPVGYIYQDKINWEQVSGLFTATGGEEWIILGNFAKIEDLTLYEGWPGLTYYYYYDDVCVLDLDAIPDESSTTDTSLCYGEEGRLFLGGRPGCKYLWNDGNSQKQRWIDTAGVYWVKSIDTANCTFSSDTFRLVNTAVIPSVIDIGNDTGICKDQRITLRVNDEDYYSFRWNTGDTTRALEITETGTYYVTATSLCNVGKDTIVVSNFILPSVSLPADTLVCNGTPIQLQYHQQGMSYSWSTGSAECCITADEPGIYSLTLTNVCGETDTDEIKIAQSGCNNCILAPTAFSPNGDGLNDQFAVYVNCTMKQYKLSIFNRWGQLVFSTVNPDKHWDGSINGEPTDIGVYFFYIEATPAVDGLKKIIKKGDLTLIK